MKKLPAGIAITAAGIAAAGIATAAPSEKDNPTTAATATTSSPVPVPTVSVTPTSTSPCEFWANSGELIRVTKVFEISPYMAPTHGGSHVGYVDPSDRCSVWASVAGTYLLALEAGDFPSNPANRVKTSNGDCQQAIQTMPADPNAAPVYAQNIWTCSEVQDPVTQQGDFAHNNLNIDFELIPSQA